MNISGVIDKKCTEQLTEKHAADDLENFHESKPPNNIRMEAVENDGDSAGKLDPYNTLSNCTEPDSSTVGGNGDSDDKHLATGKTCESTINDTNISTEDTCTLENSRSSPGEHATLLPSSPIEQAVVVSNEKIVDISASSSSAALDNNSEDKMNNKKGSSLEEDNPNASKPDTGETKDSDIQERVFETGCVLVEFKRAEASCMAAHSLHGRLFDDRIVSVEYVSPYLYRKRFPK